MTPSHSPNIRTKALGLVSSLLLFAACSSTYHAVDNRTYQAVRELETVSLQQTAQAVALAAENSQPVDPQALFSAASKGQTEMDTFLKTQTVKPNSPLVRGLYAKYIPAGDYIVPSSSGLLVALGNSFSGDQATSIEMAGGTVQSTTTSGFWDNLMKQLQSNGSINIAGIGNGGQIAEVVTTDVIRFGGSGEKLSGLGATQFQATVGTLVVDQAGQGDTGVAGSLGFSIPMGSAGSVGLGYGFYRNGADWNNGLFFSLNFAGAKPTGH